MENNDQLSARDRERYLAECRELILGEIRRIIPAESGVGPVLYDLVMEYPLRSAKALRPSLCIATCRALGGMLEAVLPSAAVLELYHNAFLIHDDIEDDSIKRRGADTLHLEYGVPIAINVGDTMLALALEPLLDNMRLVGMGKALRVLRMVARMARESAEGQAIELDWVRRGAWLQEDGEYFTLVTKKSAWYTFITPLLIGAILADCPEQRHDTFVELGRTLGIAFQIRDDVLNLIGDPDRYGKELAGDLWEGKHTLILMHAMRNATEADRAEAARILAKPRPPSIDDRGTRGHEARWIALGELAASLRAESEISERAHAALHEAISLGAPQGAKSAADVRFLMELIERCESVSYAREVARLHAERAQSILADTRSWIEPSIHRSFIEALLDYVVERDR